MLNYSSVLKLLNNSLPEDFNSETPTNLLCLSVLQSYIDSDLKVMVFGQETNDWYGSYNGENTQNQLKEGYDEFFTSDYCLVMVGNFGMEFHEQLTY